MLLPVILAMAAIGAEGSDRSEEPKKEYKVNFRWELWYPEEEAWSGAVNYEETVWLENIWDDMELAWYGQGPPVEVTTVPKKLSSTGVITISKQKATIRFSEEWDDPTDLVPEHVPEEEREDATESIWQWFADTTGEVPYGAVIEEVIDASELEMLLHSYPFERVSREIEAFADGLNRQSSINSKSLDDYRKLLFPEPMD